MASTALCGAEKPPGDITAPALRTFDGDRTEHGDAIELGERTEEGLISIGERVVGDGGIIRLGRRRSPSLVVLFVRVTRGRDVFAMGRAGSEGAGAVAEGCSDCICA